MSCSDYNGCQDVAMVDDIFSPDYKPQGSFITGRGPVLSTEQVLSPGFSLSNYETNQNQMGALGNMAQSSMPMSNMMPMTQSSMGQSNMMPMTQSGMGQSNMMPMAQSGMGQTNTMPSQTGVSGTMPMNQNTMTSGPYASDNTIFPITPTTEPPAMTLSSLQYLNGALRTQIGSRVTVQFLIGTNTYQDRTGTLLAVGSDYIILNETDSDDILFCDFFTIKFVKVFK